ncbi:phosphoethanolamine transferase [Massilia sp. TS11]|uniref:phosphoethanolamine transferase n=1 Tax=Massilia sp. TS11 TaxID=2908003 RepID=UPI001EDAB525|nr:phosphoethanolamine transferase [Massilia sp. TS11]MCG2584844.1 phosphoethanolamine transferase [Massilia sp. TS11]
MRFLLRPANLAILLSYLLLSLVPFVPMVFLGKPMDRPAQVLGIELLAWIAVWAVFKRPAWFHWLLIPAFIALPTEIYLFVFYGQGISTHHLGIIAETNPKEAMEFLGSKVWLLIAVMIGVVAWWWLTLRLARRTRELDWNDASRWVALGLLAAGAAVLAYSWEFGADPKPRPSASVSASASASEDDEDASLPKDEAEIEGAHKTSLSWKPLPYRWRLPFDFDAYAQSWPFGLVARGVDFYNERKYLAELGARSAAFRFGAHPGAAGDAPQVVLLVIGESSRYDRWSLNGYSRDTNPLLRQESNLVSFPDLITPVSATRLSVPVIISRKPAHQSLKDGFSEKSVLTAYKEAGFKTFWLSNQISFGQFDTPVSVFAREADVVQFLNLGGFTNASNFDSVLFEPLRIALKDPAPKKLVVLHTLGNHWNYSHRYPKEFDKWQPSLYGVDKPVYTDTKIKPQLNNSYDNSIRYTDWFLSQVIGQLKSAPVSSVLLFVADHGQTLYDNSCNLAFHGHNTQYEFHIPGFVWYSDAYQSRYPDKIEQLQRHQKARLATENVFHTLLDLADIRYPGERLDWSIVSPAFKPHKRVVDSYGWTNYDNAVFKGDCREVIDKDKPAKQD